MKFRKPKHGHYNMYCYECKHWQYERTVGCAHDGICYAIVEEPTRQDAYDPPCGLWEKGKKK